MVKELEVRLSDDLYIMLEEYAKSKNMSKSEVIRNALVYYLGIGEVVDKPIRETKTHTTTALFSGKCKKCGKDINQGDPIGIIKIYYEGEDRPRVFTYCLDCYYSLSDKTIVQLEVKRVKLQKTVTALKREINRLVNIYENLEKEVNLMNKIKQIINDLEFYLSRVYGGENIDIKKLIQELYDLNLNLSDFLRVVNKKKAEYAKYKVVSPK